jgi:Flp pilus assembly pilin Flp
MYMRNLLREQEGQALLEYMLMLMLALGVVSTLTIGFRRIILRLWGSMTQDITAACPGCPANPSYRFK